jgi:two-component system nitrogen regulation response regulator GlnG
VLAEGEFYRVGGRELIRTQARVIAATHQDLDAKVAAGTFRADLLHRLDVVRIHLPPLRDRREDIPRLAEYLLARAARELSMLGKRLTPDAVARMQRYGGRWMRTTSRRCSRSARKVPAATLASRSWCVAAMTRAWVRISSRPPTR